VTQVRARDRRRRRGWSPLKLVLLAAGVVVIFALGVALGQATGSDVEPGPSRTTVRTIVPVAATRETVTVTTTLTVQP
jgi:hypothetical protein